MGNLNGENLTQPEFSKDAILQSIRYELNFYPQATLIDIYKFFYQDAFGPGHFIADRETALEMLEKELKKSDKFSSTLWQKVGYSGRFYRINLKLVKDGRLSFEELFDAFLSSSNTITESKHEEWIHVWRRIREVIAASGFHFNNFIRDLEYLENNLENRIFNVSHSERYRKLYHPHYRIVNRYYFELFDLPFASEVS